MATTHFNFHKPVSGQSSAGASRASARADTVLRAFTSSLSGITATMRGAPSTPLNIRVADTNACRFFVWPCLALFRLFRRDCAAAIEVGATFGEFLGTRPRWNDLVRIRRMTG
jgi:hypothetical protein